MAASRAWTIFWGAWKKSVPSLALQPLSPSRLGPSKPFPGLRPYEEQDAAWFFGRGQQTNDLLKRLRQTRFIAVVGPSGCGKSSLVRAGLVAAIRDGYMDVSWRIATFRPGETPLGNLAAAMSLETHPVDRTNAVEQLQSGPMGLVNAAKSLQESLEPDTHFLIVADQFEELFQFVRRGGDPAQEEAKAFLKLLLTAAASDEAPIYIVITMRLEWLSECCTYIGLAEAMNEGLYLVPQMTRRQFQQSLLGPIEAAQGTITGTLLDRMLNDLDGRTDQLPVLSHAMMRMWEMRNPDLPLDLPAYVAVGTFDNCLSAQAEKEVFDPLTPENKKAAEVLFRSITQVSQNRKTRRPRSLREIRDESQVSSDRLKRVTEEFRLEGRFFLVTTGGDLTEESIVDLSHEALIRQWDRLSAWVDQEAELQSRIRRLSEVAAEWEQGHCKDKSLLYSGNSLSRWNGMKKSRFEPGSPALAFLQASQRAQNWTTLIRYGSIFMAIAIVIGVVGLTLIRALDAQREAKSKQLEVQHVAVRQVSYDQQYKDFVSAQVARLKSDKSLSPEQEKALSNLVNKDRVYLQYAAESQLHLAKRIQASLATAGYTAPGVENVGAKAPAHTQVRYFRDSDLWHAQKIADLVGKLVYGSVTLAPLPNQQDLVPPGQFEIWLAATAHSLP
jgi:energy-coupling factor transporter ATP-binding protein EcfA2